jgi:ATP-binding cassette subfamily B protein|tara:strand:+ start:765 stop:2588 length:1824 start_codon:yes stop_codon:yes gene_type:complete
LARARPDDLPPFKERMIALRLIPRFLGMVWRVQPVYAATILSFRVLLAFSPAVQLWIGKLIIDGVVANIGAATPDWTGIFRLVALELVVALASDVLQRTSNLLESLLGDLFGNRLSVRIMEHAATLDLENFEDPEFYDSLQRARQQTVGRIGLLALLLGIGQSGLSLITLLGVLVVFNGWLVLLLVFAVLPTFLGETHFAGLSYSLLYKWTPERRELDYLRYVATSDVTAKEVKLFGLADYFTRKYERLADEFYEANRALSIKRAATSGGLTIVSTLGYYAANVFIIIDTVRGFLTLGDLTLLVGSFQRSRGLISGMLLRSSDVYRQSLFLRDLFTFLEMKPRTASPENPVSVPRPIRDGVVFEGVGFRYPDKETWALRDVSLRIGAGERVALVGENGAGKTTLVKLLARLYDPTEGRILLDGIDLREYDVDELRDVIGVIFQDFVRYDLKVRENIAVGQIDAIGDQPRIVRASEMSLADSVVANLESGLDHMLGRRFKGGANLSGGEWQKVGLARAYMRDAQILILDEPTAALDARAEYQVFERFADLTEGRMAVLISHRFSTVRMADRIVVLEDGYVTEDGTHDELLIRSGSYAELFTLQAAGYR